MGVRELEAAARLLALETPGRNPPARLFFFTDPDRTPDPVAVAERLPAGAAVVYRSFGQPESRLTALALRRATRARGALLLIGADAALAEHADADGLHLPERLLGEAPVLRGRHPDWALTGAAHAEAAVCAANEAGLDAVMISPVFPSASPSAAAPLGVARFRKLAALAEIPVIALGGVNARTAPELAGSGAAGLAAVEAWLAA